MGQIDDQLIRDATGLRLCRIFGDGDLRLYELVTFEQGRAAVEIILRRAMICGRVEIEGDNADHFADIFIDQDSWTQTVVLDPGSFKYLKDKMRPRVASN